jgi:hypothetical protein
VLAQVATLELAVMGQMAQALATLLVLVAVAVVVLVRLVRAVVALDYLGRARMELSVTRRVLAVLAAQKQPITTAVRMAAVRARATIPVWELSASFGPATHANSHQQTQVTCNGTVYSNTQWSAV